MDECVNSVWYYTNSFRARTVINFCDNYGRFCDNGVGRFRDNDGGFCVTIVIDFVLFTEKTITTK